MPIPASLRLLLPLLLAALAFLPTAGARAADAPPPPDSPLSRLVRKLAASKAAAAAPTPPRKEDLLRPEFRFERTKEWLLLPELAKQLTTTPEERKAILELMTRGAEETAKLLDAQGLDRDVAVSTAFLMSQLWNIARDSEVSDAAGDVLHAQIVAALAGPEMAKMSGADKQRYWEYCVGLPVFVLGMREVATEPSARADLKIIAAAGFEAVVGVRPELVDIGEAGLVVSAKAKELLAAPAPAAPAAPKAAPASALAYDPPAGWAREEAGWATVFRATLVDVTDSGKPEENSERRHAAAIFVLPPRPAPQGGGALFEAVWREQFDAFELGDSFVHYRSRLKSGLVIHYMGRWFKRRGQEAKNDTYGVLYLVDLGDRVQPITATLVPGSSMYSMATFNEGAGFKALSFPLDALLRSVRPADGVVPYPAGGYFAADDLRGDWSRSSSAFGGSYVYAATGLSAGVGVASSTMWLLLARDGTFQYKFGGYVNQPGMGSTISSDNNDGTYVLDGDIIRFTPRVPRSYKYDKCAVGKGRLITPDGPRRILALVGSNIRGEFIGPPLIPVGDSYQGVMDWMIENPAGPTSKP